MSKRVLIAPALTLAMAAGAHAGQWKIDPVHSSINFTVTHMVVSKVAGRFSQFDGDVSFDPADLSTGSVAMTIQAASIDTDNDRRDDDLRSNDFFNVENYPEITFKSTKVIPGKDGKFTLSGDLTMHGVTKPVTFEGEMIGVVKDPYGNTRAGFSATTTINRKDFGINWHKTLDNGGLVVSDDVDISVSLELTAVNPEG